MNDVLIFVSPSMQGSMLKFFHLRIHKVNCRGDCE